MVSLMGVCGTGLAQPPAEKISIGVPHHEPGREFIHRAPVLYANYGQQDYRIPETSFYSRRNYYGPLGNFLINGYDLYTWRETRSSTSSGGSNSYVEKPGRFNLFKWNAVASESYKGWATALVIGEEIRTVFTPLTLRQSGLNGVRLDAQTAHTRLSLVGSRWGAPIWSGNVSGGDFRDTRNSSMLLGGHGEVHFGAAMLGGTVLNYHFYDADQADFDQRGGLRASQTLPSFIIVRFSDDSPLDQSGGAVVNEVRLRINGQARPDLSPSLVRINDKNPTALGRTNRLTGQFLRTIYPDEGTKFADYFYLLRLLAGEDVRNVNQAELLRFLQLVPEGAGLEASGDDVILAYFDLREEEYVGQAEVEALVGNDYRIEVFGLFDKDPRQRAEESRWQVGTTSNLGSFTSSLARGVEALRRSEGNVQDLSNLQWVTLDVASWTGRVVWGLNGSWESGGGRIRWEYARSIDYWQYPDGKPGNRAQRELAGIRDWNGARNSTHNGAFYVTGEWRGKWLDGGAEIFSIEEEYYRLLSSQASFLNEPDGFVEDNDDNDSWPDRGPGDRGRHFGDKASDPDGVFPGKDDDHDGIPDTNRNRNDVPDYEEAFLLFDVEPDEYVYGRDWNHNEIADIREDDLEPDFPYQLGQRGAHVFGKVNLSGILSMGLGRLDAEGISSGGRNESSYAQIALKAQSPAWGRIRAETLIERVHDDVENPYFSLEEVLGAPLRGGGFTFRGATAFNRVVVRDPLEWRNSIERQHYLEGELTRINGLRLWGNIRYAVNQQRGGVLIEGRDLGRDEIRRLSSVLKAEYAWQATRNWLVISQAKGLILRRGRDSVPVDLIDEWTFVPIVKTQYRITPRTHLWLGVQGLPGVPFKRKDRTDGFNSREETVRVIQLTNRSPYFGYDISMIMGLKMTSRRFNDPARAAEEVDFTSGYLRVIMGFRE
jgi:hypothetical protein